MDKRHEIEKLAYEFFQRDGCIHGRELEHWIEAERIVYARHTALVSEKPVKVKKAVAAKAVTVKVAEKKSKTAKRAPGKGKAKKSGTP